MPRQKEGGEGTPSRKEPLCIIRVRSHISCGYFGYLSYFGSRHLLLRKGRVSSGPQLASTMRRGTPSKKVRRDHVGLSSELKVLKEGARQGQAKARTRDRTLVCYRPAQVKTALPPCSPIPRSAFRNRRNHRNGCHIIVNRGGIFETKKSERIRSFSRGQFSTRVSRRDVWESPGTLW